MLDPDVLDVDPGRPGPVEQPGQLAGLVTDDDLDHGELAGLAAVLAADPGHPGLAVVEQRGHRRGLVPELISSQALRGRTKRRMAGKACHD